MFYSDNGKSLASSSSIKLRDRSKILAPELLVVDSFQGRSYTEDIEIRKRPIAAKPRQDAKKAKTADKFQYKLCDYIAIKIEMQYTESKVQAVEWFPATILEFIKGSRRQVRVCHDDGEFYTYDLLQLERDGEIKFLGDGDPTEDLFFEDVERNIAYSLSNKGEYKRTLLPKPVAPALKTTETSTMASVVARADMDAADALKCLLSYSTAAKSPTPVVNNKEKELGDINMDLDLIDIRLKSLVPQFLQGYKLTQKISEKISDLAGTDSIADIFGKHPTIFPPKLVSDCKAHSDLLGACKTKQTMGA
jgi:hypothetical protein